MSHSDPRSHFRYDFQMPGLDFQVLMLPLLNSLKDGEQHALDGVRSELIRFVELSDHGTKLFDVKGDDRAFQEAVALAQKHLAKGGLIESRGNDGLIITPFGKFVLTKRLNAINQEFLRRLPGYTDKP